MVDVDLSFSLSKDAEATLSHQDFVFTLKNWNIAQTLVITGEEDFEVGMKQNAMERAWLDQLGRALALPGEVTAELEYQAREAG